jgi:hypothetical protein
MSKKINESHLIVLKKNTHDDGVSIDYLPIINPLKGVFDDVYSKCDDDIVNMEYVNKILDHDHRLREALLDYNFCLHVRRPWQGLDDNSKINFSYSKDNLTEEEEKNEVLKDKKDLKEILEEHDLAYAIELAYENAENDSSIVAISHRKHGWAYPSFNLTKNLGVQFLTNFGYGNSSYFCIKLRFKNIDIVPFSEWVRYSDSRYDELLSYSQDYHVKNSSWKGAMKYTQSAVNLCVEDESKFIEKYITSECEWLVNGLKDIVAERRAMNDFDEKIDRMAYKGRKVSGALNFIKSISEFDSLISVKNFINDIEKLNKDLLPVLLQELGQVNYDLHLVENKLTKHKPIYDKINKIFSPLVKLKVRISSINDKNPDAYDSLIKLFNDKYHNYDELQDESTKARKKYQNIERSIADLNRYDRGFKRYIEKITNYFES